MDEKRRKLLIGVGFFAFLAGVFGSFFMKKLTGKRGEDENLGKQEQNEISTEGDNNQMSDKNDEKVEGSKKSAGKDKLDKIVLSDEEWKKKLPQEVYHILREEGTERPFSSPLNDEKRQGIYRCRGCDLDLFHSKMKYDSGTGWPSFYTTIEGAFEQKSDYLLLYKRTEYHCSRCGGHHGHVFDDGPPPTNQRWCNNGLALLFVPSDEQKSNG